MPPWPERTRPGGRCLCRAFVQQHAFPSCSSQGSAGCSGVSSSRCRGWPVVRGMAGSQRCRTWGGNRAGCPRCAGPWCFVPWPRCPRGGSEDGTGGAGADGERGKGRGDQGEDGSGAHVWSPFRVAAGCSGPGNARLAPLGPASGAEGGFRLCLGTGPQVGGFAYVTADTGAGVGHLPWDAISARAPSTIARVVSFRAFRRADRGDHGCWGNCTRAKRRQYREQVGGENNRVSGG